MDVHARLKELGIVPTMDASRAYQAGVDDEFDRIQSEPAEQLLAARDAEIENLKAQVDNLQDELLTIRHPAV